MKVLFTTHWYPGESDPAQGIFIKNHLDAVRGEVPETDLIVIRIKKGKTLYRSKLLEIGNRDYELVMESIFYKFIYVLYPLQKMLVGRRLKRFLKTRRYDIIHGNVAHPNGIIANYLSRKLGIPFVLSEHHSEVLRLSKHPFFTVGIRKAFVTTSAVMPVSTYMSDMLRPLVNIDKIHIVPNVVKSSVFHYTDSYEKIPESLSLVAIGFWGDINCNYKLPRLMVEAAMQFALQTRTHVTFYHAGECLISEELLSKSDPSWLTLEFLGPQTPDQLNNLLNKTDVFVHATLGETFCVVAVEAQKAVTPAVVSDFTTLHEVLDPYGVIYAPNDVEGWVQAFSEIVSTPPDRKLIAEKSKNKYTAETVGKAIAAVYEHVLTVK